MADETPQDPDDAEPITPEVLDGGDGTPPWRGASSRKRRVGPTPDDGPAPDDEAAPLPGVRPGRPATGRMFRAGCVLLVGVGVMEVFFGATRVADPDKARCDAARFDIENANEDDDDFNDVDLDEGSEVDELECDEAIALAGEIPEEEDEPAEGEFAAASTFRSQGLILLVLGLAHALSGFFTLRTKNRMVRNIALGNAAFGILVPILGFISLIAMAFVVFALAFSTDAKTLFPVDRTRPSLFRPKPPAGS